MAADGKDPRVPLKQEHGLTRDEAEQQARQWLKEKPGSQVYLYRRHGETSVLVQILTEPKQKHARRDG